MSGSVGSGAQAAAEPSGRPGSVRRGLHVPAAVMQVLLRDPQHVPERLTAYTVDQQAAAVRTWARRAREAAPDVPVAALADQQWRRTVSTARIDGAIAGTPFFIALVPAYIGFLQQEARLHLRVGALYDHDPADPEVAADFLVLRGVYPDRASALAGLATVRAQPLPGKRTRMSLRAWYEAVLRVLVLGGFISPPEKGQRVRPPFRQRVMTVVRFVLAALLWALTWIVPVTFMIVMSWACENDARRFGERVLERYAEREDDPAAIAARADVRAGGHRAVSAARGALVFLSVALPLALIASTQLRHHGPLGLDLSQTGAALAALALVIGVTATAIRS